MRLVVRLTKGKPSRVSICDRRLLTAAVVMRISRAAALKLPAMAKAEKKPRSAACRRGSIVD
jgi:hypothetical protein